MGHFSKFTIQCDSRDTRFKPVGLTWEIKRDYYGCLGRTTRSGVLPAGAESRFLVQGRTK
jgi:hypothetical protein